MVNYEIIEGSTEAEEHHYNQTNLTNSIPKHHMIIKCGDFNAYLGIGSVQHSFHETTNSKSRLLIDHATSCNLLIANTIFKKRKGKLWTYMNNSKSQIDYILIIRKWKNSLLNCEAYNTFSSIGSDNLRKIYNSNNDK